MIFNQSPQPIYRACLLFVLLLVLFLAGCLPTQSVGRRTFDLQRQPSPHNGRLNLFLTLEDKQGPAIRLEITRLEILANDIWLPLIDDPKLLDSKIIGDSQYFIGGMEVPPGQYNRLRLTISKGSILNDNQPVDAITEAQQLEISLGRPLELKMGDSKTLLFTWDVEASLLSDGRLAPVLFVMPALRQLTSNIMFVSCPEINTVFVVRTDKNWVVDSLGLKGGPIALAVDPASAGQRLYALTPLEKKIKVIDLSSQRVINSYPTLNDEATHLTISPDGDKAYVLYERSGYVSRMDLRTGQIESRVLLGSRPNYSVYLEDQRLLAVSLSFADRVVLLDPENLKIVKIINTGSKPEGIIVSDNYLYAAERGEASVISIDLANVSNRRNLMVGFGPRRILDTGDQIMVSNYDNGSLSVLLPGQLGAVQEIHGLGKPHEMAFDPLYRRLYVTDESNAALAVIDMNFNQLLGYIFLGATPLGLTGVQ